MKKLSNTEAELKKKRWSRKKLQYSCLPVNFTKLLRIPFLQNTPGGVGNCLRKKFYIVGVHKKVFEWLVKTKNYSRSSCASIFCFSIFSITCFFTNEVWEHFSMVHWIKLSGSNHPKVFLPIYWRNIYVWTLVYEVVCACGFEFLANFLRIAFVISGSTEYEFSAAIFIELSRFDVKCLLLSWDACVYRLARLW